MIVHPLSMEDDWNCCCLSGFIKGNLFPFIFRRKCIKTNCGWGWDWCYLCFFSLFMFSTECKSYCIESSVCNPKRRGWMGVRCQPRIVTMWRGNVASPWAFRRDQDTGHLVRISRSVNSSEVSNRDIMRVVPPHIIVAFILRSGCIFYIHRFSRVIFFLNSSSGSKLD